jgi:hypothetical protein
MSKVAPLEAPNSCVTCDQSACAMHKQNQPDARHIGRASWIVDEAWPEYRSYLAVNRTPHDQVIAPGIFSRAGFHQYRWDGRISHGATWETMLRKFNARKVAKAMGHIRQASYLRHDRAIAAKLIRMIDYRARHLIVAQSWLPWLSSLGALGGRSYDVLMTRYPYADIHRQLDAAAIHWPASTTISDFRVSADLVAIEQSALLGARRIVTPHQGIASLYPMQAWCLAWHAPCESNQNRSQANRVAFLGPTIARQRPDLVHAVARQLRNPLVIVGDELEGSDFWHGVSIERRNSKSNWRNDVAVILHPAAMTTQPRQLLSAQAAGIRIYATPGSGLTETYYRPFDRFAQECPEFVVL